MLPDLLRILTGRDPAEPLIGRAAITAVLGALSAFGVLALTDDQASALVNLAVVLGPILGAAITAALARPKVTPAWRAGVTDGDKLNGVDPNA